MKAGKIIGAFVDPLLGAGDVKATIKSQLLPTITIDPLKIKNSPTNPLFKLAKPEVHLNAYGFDKVIAPWGTPTKNYFPFVLLWGLILIAVFGYIGYAICRSTS